VLRKIVGKHALAQTRFRRGAPARVSYKTVAADCAMLRTKFGARTSSEMVRIAVELKLI
jgi:hypothetical protein